MRRIVIAVLISCLAVAGTAIQCHAQKYKAEVVLNTNASFSLVSSYVRISFKVADYQIDGLDTKVTPAISGTADIGVTDRISVGFGYFYQTARADWTSFVDTITDSVYTGEFNFRAKRYNYGVRALLHFGNNDAIDPYFGFRVGFGQWKVNTNVTAFELFDARRFKAKVTFQAIFGVRYYFLPFIGVNGEIAFGYPYFLSGGLSFRFGGMKYLD